MKTCPECEGKKGIKFPSTNPLDVYSDKPTIYEFFKCDLCKGKGKIVDIAWSIWAAKSGITPPIK